MRWFDSINSCQLIFANVVEMEDIGDSKSPGIVRKSSNLFIRTNLIGASPSGKAADSDSAYRWFESISPCQSNSLLFMFHTP